MKKQKLRVLSVYSLVMITITSVDSIRNLPATALFGSQLFAFFIIAAITFLIPTALVSAELATAIPKQGGVYVWVKEAFGAKFGTLAIWFQWVENIFWYPAILSFIAGTIAYLINPTLAGNKYFIIAVILVFFWGATFLNLFGMRVSAFFSELCGIFGLIFPMILIMGLGSYWVFSGHHLQVDLSAHSLLPNFAQGGTVVALTGIILSFCGMEITTVYAQEVKNPQRDYPKALLISTVILLSTLAFGSMAIAIVIPKAQISLVSGLMEAFNYFFTAYHLAWLTPIIALMIIVGGTGGLSNWIIAPSKGLLVAAQDGQLPHFFAKANKHNAPTSLLLFQAIVTSLFTLVFLLMPGVNGAYWVLTALAAQLYMIMYILMFAAGIYLKIKRPELVRPFAVPGGKFGHIVTGSIGIMASLFTIVIGFFPPTGIQVGSLALYDVLLITGLLIMVIIPFFFKQLEE